MVNTKTAGQKPSVKDRLRILTEARNLKMARSAHAYVRGNTAQPYTSLAADKTVAIPSGPSAWICGDCHIGNLGPIANTKGNIDIQIRDLDQTVIGNPAYDLIRLGVSLASAARGSDLPGVTTTRMLEQLVLGYELAFGEDISQQDAHRPQEVEKTLKTALKRKWKHLGQERNLLAEHEKGYLEHCRKFALQFAS